MTKSLRVGVLGTGYIVGPAILQPAKQLDGINVEAVGSRSLDRARQFAEENGIAKALSYEATVRDPDIDIVYIALPNSLHAEWSLRALEAGKHVLCEKPMALNESQAQEVASAALRSDRIFMEAFHYPYHPFSKRIRDLLSTGALGELKSAEAYMQIPSRYVQPGGIRHAYSLGGGAMMDAGCYTLHGLRDILGEVTRVVSAEAQLDSLDEQVDLAMRASLEFEGGRTGTLHTSFLGEGTGDFRLMVQGEHGRMEINSLYLPQWGGAVKMSWGARHYAESADPTPTYIFQLRELVRCVRDGAPVLTSAQDGTRIMRSIDEIYRQAGLKIRGVH